MLEIFLEESQIVDFVRMKMFHEQRATHVLRKRDFFLLINHSYPMLSCEVLSTCWVDIFSQKEFLGFGHFRGGKFPENPKNQKVP